MEDPASCSAYRIKVVARRENDPRSRSIDIPLFTKPHG